MIGIPDYIPEKRTLHLVKCLPQHVTFGATRSSNLERKNGELNIYGTGTKEYETEKENHKDKHDYSSSSSSSRTKMGLEKNKNILENNQIF